MAPAADGVGGPERAVGEAARDLLGDQPLDVAAEARCVGETSGKGPVPVGPHLVGANGEDGSDAADAPMALVAVTVTV